MKVQIEKLDHFGRGITHIDGKICFVKHALKGEIVELKILKETKKYYLGEAVDYLETSPNRIIEKCPFFNICGGCSLQHLDFTEENIFKRRKVQELMAKLAHINPNLINETVYTEEYNYRNKVVFHCKDKHIGFYKQETNDLIEIDKCPLLDQKINGLIPTLKRLVKENDIDEITIRISNDSSKLMVKIIGKVEKTDELINQVDVLIVNDKVVTKEDKIITTIKDKKYYLSIDSFFQVNKTLTEKLYDKVLEVVKEEQPNKVLDLYCGTGTIGIYINDEVKEIVAVDCAPSSIKDAKLNKKLNNVGNITFINEKVENVIDTFNDIDLIIVDPPRAGLDKKTINYLEKINPKTIIYVSCDPSTLGRDLNLLTTYEVKSITPFNMFPRTHHVENVAVLQHKKY